MSSKLTAVSGILTGAAALGAVVVLGVVGLRLARADAAERVYRARLESLAADYEGLRTNYNEAVRRTAVTELVVAEGKVTALVRSAHGAIAEIPTTADPSREVYVDFALVDGRVWIRRVFDSATRPEDATVIDPRLAEVDWDGPTASVGQAVYRTLGEGRWVVRVSGDGALGLERVPDDAVISLAEAPPVRSYDEVQAEVEQSVRAVGWRDVLGAVVGGD
jgi:hypothetical protein